MLTPYIQPYFLSKIATDFSGRQFRLTFLVAVVDGEMRGRLISVEPVVQTVTNRQIAGTVCEYSNFTLPIFCTQNKPNTQYIPAFVPIVSPYFSLDFLINSQPTRAPAFARILLR